MESPVIGIDLGTTYSCVGVIQNDEVHIIANNEGKRITPSVVAYVEPTQEGAEFDVLVGDEAKDKTWIGEDNVIFCAKRLIGRAYDDPSIQDDFRVWPFQVINENGKAKYKMKINEKIHTFFPEEISAMVLKRMKSMAEGFLGVDEVKRAVITVPAYFTENQKKATKDAARIAGLEVLELLSEPTAAAIAYGVDLQRHAVRNVLVFDFGGGTFDVSIISVLNEELTVRTIAGDPHLGGEDIDNNLARHFEESFNQRHKTQLKADNGKAWRRLKHRCEKLKICLSRTPLENLKLDRLHEGHDLTGSVSRAKLEGMNADLFKKAIKITEDAIQRSKLKKNDIHDILMVGGSTLIPKIRLLLKELLPNAKMPEDLNPHEAVAVGATILAATKTNTPLERRKYIKMWNVLPQSLGVGTGRGLMHKFIDRNTCVPVKETLIFSTEKDNQNILRFKVYEGEDTDVSRNYLLGEFRIAGIPPAPRGVPQIEVTFSVNEDCLLEVTALDLAMSRMKGLKIQYDHERLSEEELQELQARVQTFKKHNEEVRSRLDALKDLEEFTKGIRTCCLREPMRNSVPDSINSIINEIYDWVDDWYSKQEYPSVKATEVKKKQLEDVWNPFITEFNKGNKRPKGPVLLD